MHDDIFKGESKQLEFKRELSPNSETYVKTIIAFANTAGGKLIIGIDDESKEVVGVDKIEIFQIMDKLSNSISDSCEPQIVPSISIQTINGKSVVIVEVFPGGNRPYFLKSLGRDRGTYIRVGATSRPAHADKIKELEIEGVNKSWDEITCLGYEVHDEDVEKLCNDITSYRKESGAKDTTEVTKDQLLNWRILKKVDDEVLATNAFALLVGDHFSFAKIQCAVFKGNDRVVFVDKREYSGSIYEQLEEAYKFVLRNINLGAEIKGLIRKDKVEKS